MNKEILEKRNLKQITLYMNKDLFLKIKMNVVKNEITITKYINDLVVSDIEK